MVRGFFLAKQAEGCAPSTLHDDRAGLRRLAWWTASAGRENPGRLRAADLKASWPRCGRCPHAQDHLQRVGGPQAFLPVMVGGERPAVAGGGGTGPEDHVPQIEPLIRDQVAVILTACEWTGEAATLCRRTFVMRRDTALCDRAIVFVLLDSGGRM